MVLGAVWNGSETRFAVFSSAAAYGGEVELCLLDDRGGERRIPLAMENDIWTATVPDVGPGQRYAYRAGGPWAPERGLFFDQQRLLVDPYAQAIELTAQRLLDLGLTNYWGYSTLGFFAPHAGYRSGTVAASQVVQFKEMVKTLHRAGLEAVSYTHL